MEFYGKIAPPATPTFPDCIDGGKVLETEIKKGHKNPGSFYGAAHFPDRERSLFKLGYKKTKQEWLTAWSVPKKQ